jgi:DNA-binding beta-propeller fold protein YncE
MKMKPIALAALLVSAQAVVAQPKISVVANEGLVAPFGVDFGDDGTIYFVEMAGGEQLRAIDTQGMVRTLAGTGKKGDAGDGGPATRAQFNGPHSLAVGPGGIVYVADTFNSRVRAFDPKTGDITAFAGTGERGFAGDGGPAEKAKFGNVYCLAFDAKRENLYVADLDNRRIRAIDMKTRGVRTVTGNGTKGVPADGANATAAPLLDPRAVAVGPDGRVFILERGGHALRVVAPDGKIATVAGTGKPGASLTQMNGPKHLCIEPRGDDYAVLIADTENHRVLRLINGKLELVAGTGKKGSSLTELAQPHGVAVRPKTGEIYIADSSNNRILKIEK